MKRIKKFIAPVLCAVIILCGFIVLTGLKTVKVANAETNRQLTVEDYTNSDNACVAKLKELYETMIAAIGGTSNAAT